MAELDADPARVFDQMRRPDRLERGAVGRRARSLTSRRSGKYSRHRLLTPGAVDLALDATLRAAAVRTGTRGALAVERQDLRRKVREHRSPFSVAFVVDNSYSVQAEGMVETVKGLTFALLEDATHRGDKVALVAFNGGLPEATVALPLTTSRTLARRRLEEIPLSGRTPLADGLRQARKLLRQESVKHPNAVPVVVVVTDGLPTVPLQPGGSALGDALAEGVRLKRSGALVVVADATPPGAKTPSCGPDLAKAAGGVHLPIGDLAPDAFGDLLERLSG